jgi:hypothetical protein
LQTFKVYLKEIKNPKIRILLDFCIITAIGVIVFRNFLFSDKWPAGGDALGIVGRAYIFGKNFRWLFLWRPHSFGFVEVIHGYDFFLMILHWIFGNAIVTAKSFLFLTFVVSGFSSYILVHWYTKNHTASLAAALVYTLNPWLFSQYTEAHGDILFSYALAPLVYLSIFRAFEKKKLKDILIAGLALGIMASTFHPECLVIYATSFPIFAIIFVLMPTKNKNRLKHLRNFFKVAFPLVIIAFGLSSFAIVPMIFSVQPRYYLPSYKYYLEETYGGVYKNLTDAFTLGAVEVWGYVKAVDITTGIALSDFPTKILSLAIFSLAYCTVFIRRNKYTVFFAVSAFISMFIAKGPNPPFGYLYVWAWFNVPYFAVFRAANRWIMMACLSHALFVAILVDILTKYVKEKNYQVVRDAFSSFNKRIAKSLKTQKLEFPLKVTGDFFVSLHKVLHYISVLLLIIIFVNGFLVTWYFFREGLQVYSLPETYIKPYEWIGQQSGDFKVVSVNRGPGRWREEPSSGFDFGYGGMLTDIGWAHDVGFESSFIHDKPVMQDGGWDINAQNFVNYLRFRLAGQQLTSELLKITGLFNYKYIVLPGYLDPDIKDFFLNQTGAIDHIVYDEDGSLIIENPYWTPRFFGVGETANILGGYDIFPSLCKLDMFKLNQTALFFLNQLDGGYLKELLNSTAALVFVNADPLDLTMLQLSDGAKIISAADFGVCSYDFTKYWVQWNSWKNIGAFVYTEKTLTTVGNVSIDIPFEISANGTYEILLRVGFVSHRGKLSVSVDNTFIGEIKPESHYWSKLSWVKINTLDLKKGMHTITLINDGTGWNDVEAIGVVESNLFQSAYEEMLRSIESFQGRIINIMGAANAFAYTLSEGWTIYYQKYECEPLKAENAFVTLKDDINALASSVQNNFTSQNAVDGSFETRWASDPTQEVPQWLEIELPTMQELAGVKIFFETAYARDYEILTWNGSNWITQKRITGNTLLSPSHSFPKPVKTSKLLLNVTAYGTEHRLVSIFEIELCKSSSVTARHFVLKEGNYMVALRLLSGPDYGTLHLQMGNYSLSFDCYSSEEKFQWYEAGPFWLERGEQNISVSAYGKVIFDQMILYSLKEDENSSALHNLFCSEFHSPMIDYEMINPTAYNVHIKSEQPFFLVFSEAYNPLWKAKFEDGQEVNSIMAYSIVNSFYINRTGEFSVRVYFEGQNYADIGLKISVSFLTGTVAIILVPNNLLNQIKKRMASLRNGLWRLRSALK